MIIYPGDDRFKQLLRRVIILRKSEEYLEI